MSRTLDAIAGNTKNLSDDAQACGHDVLKLADSIGTEAKARIDSMGDNARVQARAAYANVKAQVNENPVKALGAAIGVGVLLGFLIKGPT